MGEPVKLTSYQRELLRLLARGPRYGVSDATIAMQLQEMGFAKHYPKSNAWDITAKGKRRAAQRDMEAVR